MSNMILLVVDVQNGLINTHPYNEQRVIENIIKLIQTARGAKKEVVYIRHDDGEGTDLERGTDGWQIYADIAPAQGELIFEKQYNSAFRKTELRDYLNCKKIDTIMIVGLQTEYCMDATIKTAFDYEYKIIVPEEANTTFDNEYLTGEKLYQFYNYKIWNKRFANVVPVDEAVRMLKSN